MEKQKSERTVVMRGLDPRIHGAARVVAAWIAGSSPGDDNFSFLLLCVSVPLWFIL